MLVMLPNSSARSVAFTFGRCCASLSGIVFVQIAPAAHTHTEVSHAHLLQGKTQVEGRGGDAPIALPTAPPISVQSRTIAVVMAMSTCGTEACAATLEQTEAKPPPKPWMICVQTTSASDAWAPR